MFKLIISKNKGIIKSRGISFNIDGYEDEMFNGSNGLLGYNKEIIYEVKICNFI